MKTISKLLIFFLTFALTACQKTIDEPDRPENVIKITDGMIQSPKWLVDEINSVADKYSLSPVGDKHYPLVYSFEYNEQDYIYVMDVLSSIIDNPYFFTFSGEPVDLEDTDLYNSMTAALKDNGVLLWRHEPIGTSDIFILNLRQNFAVYFVF